MTPIILSWLQLLWTLHHFTIHLSCLLHKGHRCSYKHWKEQHSIYVSHLQVFVISHVASTGRLFRPMLKHGTLSSVKNLLRLREDKRFQARHKGCMPSLKLPLKSQIALLLLRKTNLCKNVLEKMHKPAQECQRCPLFSLLSCSMWSPLNI